MKSYLIVCFAGFTLTISANSSSQQNTDSYHNFFDDAGNITFPQHKHFDAEYRNLILESAPKDLKKFAAIIQNCVKEKNLKCPARSMIATGNDIARNKLVRAIAENAGIPCVQINTVFLLNRNQNFDTHTANCIKKIRNTKEKIIVFLEALDCTRNDHVYGGTVEYLLDLFEHNPNIIVVASVQEPHELPSYLKEKFAYSLYYAYHDAATIKVKKDLLHYHLKKFNTECDQACEEYISKLLKTMHSEAIESLVDRANRHARLGKEKWSISQKDLEDAVENFKEMEKLFEKRK